MKYEDLSTRKFGKLQPIKKVSVDKQRRAIWLCKCDCGNQAQVTASNLKWSGVMSCGCARRGARMSQSERIRLHNKHLAESGVKI